MFALRGLAIAFSIFALLYTVLSLTILCLWHRLLRFLRFSAATAANFLFILRVMPFALALTATLVLAVPSFVLLEPRNVTEPLGIPPLALGLFGMLMLSAGIGKAFAALGRTSKLIARWSKQSDPRDSSANDCGSSLAVQRISGAVPPLTAAGIFRPSVWLSSAAEVVLTKHELQCALRHEAVHVRRYDNLRKLILRFVAFPGMSELESAWSEYSEMAADEAAVSSAAEALDLAAAVIKLSRLTPLVPSPELTTGLVHTPAKSIHTRVERLLAWSERPLARKRLSWKPALFATVALLGSIVFSYSGLLVRVHAATEWLVR